MQLGGLSDLEQALNGTAKRPVAGDGSCSAFIKILPKNEDLLISQVTWNSYQSMLRVYKLYELQLVNNSNPGKQTLSCICNSLAKELPKNYFDITVFACKYGLLSYHIFD